MPAESAAEHEGRPEDEQGVERLMARIEPLLEKGDNRALVSLIREYGKDLADVRARNRELAREKAEITKRAPKDGDVVLSGDDAKAYQALVKLDVPLKDLPAKLTEATSHAKENAAFKRDSVVEEAAKALGWNVTVLKGLVRLNGIALAKQSTKQQDGGKTESWVVMPPEDAEDDDEPVSLTEYVEQHLGDFRDALAGAEAARKSDREPPPPGRPHLRQNSGAQGRGKDVADQAVEADIRSRHPLLNA